MRNCCPKLRGKLGIWCKSKNAPPGQERKPKTSVTFGEGVQKLKFSKQTFSKTISFNNTSKRYIQNLFDGCARNFGLSARLPELSQQTKHTPSNSARSVLVSRIGDNNNQDQIALKNMYEKSQLKIMFRLELSRRRAHRFRLKISIQIQ